MNRVPSRISTVLALIVAATAAAANAATVSGVVTDAASGLNVPSMIVRAYSVAGDDLGFLVTTDSDSRYLIGLPEGQYRILAYDQNGVYATSFAGDAESFETSPVLNAQGNVTNYDFALRKGGTLTGRVTSGNSPVSGAVVAAYNLSGTRRGFTATDSSGNYSLVLPPGQYKLVAFDDSKLFAPKFFRNTTSFDTATIVEVAEQRLDSGTDFVLSRAARLVGYVIDSDTGEPVTGLAIAAYDKSGALIASQQTTTDLFDIAIEPGTYRLVAADPTHRYAPAFYGEASTFTDSTPVTVGPSEFRSGLRFQVVHAGHVSGLVTDASGAPLKKISVAAYNPDGSLRTIVRSDALGHYQLDLPSGTFKIIAYDEALVYAPQFHASANDFQSATAVSISTGEDVAIDFRLAVGGNISGVARDSVTNTALASITVAAYDGNGNVIAFATTNDAGEYKLVAPAGSYRLVAFDPWLRYAAAYVGGASAFEISAETHVESGSVAHIDFSMTRGVLLSGSVTDMALRSVTGVEIIVFDIDGNRVATARSVNGHFDVTLLPGTYKVVAADPEHRYATTFYGGARSFDQASTLTISRDTPPPLLTFVLWPAPRRRAAGH